MSSSLKKNLMKYGISVGVGLILTYIYISARLDLANLGAVEKVELYRIFCDGFSVPGILLLMFGFLMSVSNQGVMDGVSYVLVNAARMLIPTAALKSERYNEYVERKRANRVKGYGFLYVVALVFLAVAGVFMALFYSIYQR